MKIIVCADDRLGMMFHKRRLSRDRIVVNRIIELSGETVLWMDPYSKSLFSDMACDNFRTDSAFLEKAGHGEYCFVENRSLRKYESEMESLIVCYWNRRYPADFYLDIPLTEWKEIARNEYPGYSHEKITEITYINTRGD